MFLQMPLAHGYGAFLSNEWFVAEWYSLQLLSNNYNELFQVAIAATLLGHRQTSKHMENLQ